MLLGCKVQDKSVEAETEMVDTKQDCVAEKMGCSCLSVTWHGAGGTEPGDGGRRRNADTFSREFEI